MLEGQVTKLKVCGKVNPPTFLPEKENEMPDHNCQIKPQKKTKDFRVPKL